MLVLYGTEECSGVRAVLLTIKALELDYELRQQLEAGIVQQQSLPALQDAGDFIWDSHAIMGYLVHKFGQSDALYPREALPRSVVDQRLHFESGVLQALGKQLKQLLRQEKISELPVKQLQEIYSQLEQFLDGHEYMAGDQLTIADFSLVSGVSLMHLSIAPIAAEKYPNLCAWLARISALPYYEQANLSAARRLADTVRSKLPKQFDKLWQKAFEDIKSGAGKV